MFKQESNGLLKKEWPNNLSNTNQKMISSIAHDTLFKRLKLPKTPLLIDVRDIDYGEGGTIQNSLHIESYNIFPKRIMEILDIHQERESTGIVCFCKFGKARSVQSAMRIQEYLDSLKPTPEIEVSYLKGGFQMFRAWYWDSGLIVPVTKA